jgi:hypothetical protein
LTNEDGSLYRDYTKQDINLMYGRPADWEPPPPEPVVIVDTPVATPDPNWVNPTVSNGNPSYTGKMCYAGVDYVHIDHNGWAGGSDCRSRIMGNVFELDWSGPNEPFACPMMYCQSKNDQSRIRMNQ